MTTGEYKQKCEWLAEFYTEAAKTGRQMQMRCEKWQDYDRGPNMESLPSEWRLRPDPTRAWIVWYEEDGMPKALTSFRLEDAEKYAAASGGTIQEINRSKPQ